MTRVRQRIDDVARIAFVDADVRPARFALELVDSSFATPDIVGLGADQADVRMCRSACQSRCSPAPKPTSSQTSSTGVPKYARGIEHLAAAHSSELRQQRLRAAIA